MIDNSGMVEKIPTFKTETFYMDSVDDIRRYDALRNNPNVHVIKEKDYKIKESERTGDITNTTERIYYLVHYQIDEL